MFHLVDRVEDFEPAVVVRDHDHAGPVFVAEVEVKPGTKEIHIELVPDPAAPPQPEAAAPSSEARHETDSSEFGGQGSS